MGSGTAPRRGAGPPSLHTLLARVLQLYEAVVGQVVQPRQDGGPLLRLGRDRLLQHLRHVTRQHVTWR